jgi:hypothetical protein
LLGTVTGAGVTPSKETLAALAEFDVVLWADHDRPGRLHMRRIGEQIKGLAARVSMLKWNEARDEGDDAADFFERGGTVEQVRALIDGALDFDEARESDGPPDIRSDDCIVDEDLGLPGDDDPRPRFQYEKGKGHEAVAEACRAIAEIPGVFQRGHQLVRIVGHTEGEAGDVDVKRTEGTPIIAALPTATLWEILSRARQWVSYSMRQHAMVAIEPPERVISALLAHTSWPGVRQLVGLVGHPAVRPDGTILDQPGYDPITGLYLFSRTSVRSIPEHPTHADALAAKDVLLDIVSEFKFASEADKATWLAALLTPIARPAFEGPAPLFLADASTRSSGKTLLCDVISMISTGFPMPRSPYDERDEEMRKRILAHGLAGDVLVLIDNAPNGCRIGWPSLDAALTTTDLWKDRVLGKSENAAVPLRITWFATGNNIGVRADAARRVLKFRLEPVVENPEELGGYKYPRLLTHVRDNRGKLLCATLTILRAYIVANRPKQRIVTIGSYESWSDLVQSAVAWVGLPDPALTLATKDLEANPEDAAHVQALARWPDVLSDARGATTSELLATLKDGSGTAVERLREAILELCPGRPGQLPDLRQLGTKFRTLRGRWRQLDDGRLACFSQTSKTRAGAARWTIRYQGAQSVQGVQSVTGTGPAEIGSESNDEPEASTEEDSCPELPNPARPPGNTPSTLRTLCNDEETEVEPELWSRPASGEIQDRNGFTMDPDVDGDEP